MQKCIELKNKGAILKLATIIYNRTDVYDSLYSLCSGNSVKLHFDIYTLFKEDPKLQEYSKKHYDGLFPFDINKYGYWNSYTIPVLHLIDEGYDNDALELFSIFHMSTEEKIECLNKMKSLYEAKCLEGHVIHINKILQEIAPANDTL